MSKTIRPYGTWPSPISAAAAAATSLRFGLLLPGSAGVCWSEVRPAEGGRGVIMRARPEGGVEELLPAPFSARSRVHEYGGGEFVCDGETVWFVEAASQDIHALSAGAAPRRVTRAPDTRFADLAVDTTRGRLIAVAERHGPAEEHGHPENLLVAISLQGPLAGTVTPLARGRDFYSSPRLSPDGTRLAWLAWDLPHMPWEAAELRVAPVDDDGHIGANERLAGGDDAAVFQPEWLADGSLVFVSEASGWGNLQLWDGATVRPVTALKADLMRPQWAFGMRSHAPLADGRIAAVFLDRGEARLEVIDPLTGASVRREAPFRGIDSIAAFADDIAVIGASDLAPPAVARLPLDGGPPEILRGSAEMSYPEDDISVARRIEVESGGEPVYALYYPPASATCAGSVGERPPAIVTAHGGPTGSADRGFKIRTQFWASRGFGVCDVDYSGSSGYGRDYRRRLDGQWGIRDVADVAAVARHLAVAGLADPSRLLISGSSAGGYTVLMALAMLDLFAAGTCSYAVCDLAQLQRITHKFEAGYLHGLTGATPENADEVFTRRSPFHLADRISAPVIFFQGEDDKVVPPQQSRAIVEALRANGVRADYHAFAGEAHGFRQAATLSTVLALEYAFYCEILGLIPSGAPAAA